VKRRGKGSASDRLQLFHQEDGAAALDLAGDPAMQMRRHAGDAARENFAAFGDKFFQHIRVFVINRFDRDVDSPARHGAIRASKCGTTLGSFGLHGWFTSFPDGEYAASGMDCISFSRADWACAGFSCFAWSCNAKAAGRAFSPRCIPE
jgi:hypothetical protein